MARLPGYGCTAVGANVTVTVQVAPEAKDVGQLCVAVYTLPVTVRERPDKGKSPALATIRESGLVVPVGTLPKSRLSALKAKLEVITTGAVPAPVSATDRGPLTEPSMVTVSG
jgi:hypothetical protein